MWLARLTAWALLIEVALIDLQRWRSVASHFNRRTPLDSWLYDVMGGLILAVTAVIIDLTVRWCRPRPPEIFGMAGVVKFPHGVVIHAIQWLPFIAWASLRGGQPVAEQRA